MKKTTLLMMCFLLIIKGSYGQQPIKQNTNPFDNPRYLTVAAFLVVGVIYYVAKVNKNKKRNNTSYTPSTSIRKERKENIKKYKIQVQELAEIMKTNNNFLKDKDVILGKIKNIQRLYESSSSDDNSFAEKVSKYKTQYKELKKTYSDFVYKTYYPEYEKEKKTFNTNIASNNISSAKKNLDRLNELNSELSWDENENSTIPNEVENFNQTIEVNDQFQSKLTSVQNQIKSGTLNYPDDDISELTTLMNKWAIKTKLSIALMKSQIDDLNCQYNKNLYSFLTDKSKYLLSQVVTLQNIDEFNSSVKDFVLLAEKAKTDNCVGYNKYTILKNKVILKSDFENVKISKEEEVITKKQAIVTKKIKEEKPLEITYISQLFPDDIGRPEGHFGIINNSDETIIAIDAEISLYDAMGRKVEYLTSYSNVALYTFKTYISPGATETLEVVFYENCQAIDVKIIAIRYEGGKKIQLKKPIRYTPSNKDN